MRAAQATSTVPILAFGDPESGRWGVAVGGEEPRLALGALADSQPPKVMTAALETSHADAWSLSVAPRSITVAPSPAASTHGDSLPVVELCRLTGNAGPGDDEHPGIDHAGVRCPAFDLPRLDSLRLVAAWFPEGTAAALVAARAEGARGHDRDLLAAAFAGEGDNLSVFDPRLSSTYDGRGALLRAGIELWLGESEDADMYPRRFAGEAAGRPVSLQAGALRAEAYPMRCHGRAGDGIGVCVVASPA
jgi:hypothetical protein